MGNNKILTWAARLLSLFLLAFVVMAGVLAFGYAGDSSKVRVAKTIDEKFLPDEANTLGSMWLDGVEERDVLSISENNLIYSYVSGVKTSELDFWMVGAKMQGSVPEDTSVTAKVRASKDGEVWTEWYDLDLAVSSVDGKRIESEVPVLFADRMKYAQYSLVLSSTRYGVSPEINDVTLVYMNPDQKLAMIKKSWGWMVGKVVGKEEIDVITREEWGADESQMTWDDIEYAPVEQIIVHHTAGSNNSTLDPAAVVRGIYYFHAVEKEWGDMGYNYLIDQYGNIYEGRKGGIGAVGAHASGNNYGSAGIAVIGNFVKESPKANALSGLIDLIGYIGYQADLDLTGEHNFEGKNIPVVAGHLDVNSTECPGEVLYEMLADVAVAADKGLDGLPERTYEAKFLSQSEDNINLTNDQLTEINIRYKNTGSGVWFKDRENVVLVPVEPYPRNSGFASSRWNSSQVVGSVNQTSVMSGSEGLFVLELKGLKAEGVFEEKFALKGPKGIIEGTEFEVVVENKIEDKVIIDDPVAGDKKNDDDKDDDKDNKTDDKKPDLIVKELDKDLYHAAWVAQSDNVSLFAGEEKSVWIDIKNTGKAPWYRDGQYPVRLGTNNPIDRNSVFVADNWLASNRVEMSQWSVEPGEVARFRFVIQVPEGTSAGLYQEYFRPVVENVTWMEDQGVYVEVNVNESVFGAELVGQSEKNVTMGVGKMARVWIDLKNTGNVTWRKDGDNPLRIGTDRDLDRASIFYTPGYWINQNRAGGMKKSAVAPGDVGRFEIVVTAPDNPGSYREYFRPVVENLNWMDDMDIYWDLEVK